MTTRIFGSGIRRREDPRLITGGATYTDDVSLPGTVHAAILRSPHAHARIRSIDTTGAASALGVLAVYTGADVEGVINPIPCAWIVPDSDVKAVAHPAIAKDVVRYQGDAVAVVVADSRYQAEDAMELIQVDYEVLPATVNSEAAMQAGAPQLHEDAPNNQAFHWVAEGGDTDAAFANADVVVRDTILQQRLVPNAMEPRSAVATWLGAMGELTIWTTSQNPHICRFLGSLVTGVPEHKLRVIAPEVGGGFGSKIPVYADEMITAFCSMQLGRPVKWTETRSENYIATIHGRDHIQHVEMAATSDGKITGVRAVVYAGMGAYLSTAAPGVPTILHGLMYSGPYDIGATKADVYGVFTNTTPVDAYRGAGRPEATFLLERMVDVLAAELGMDPVELRRKNLIPKFEEGRDVATGLTYDSGDYETSLDMVLDRANYTGLREEQAHLREHHQYMGIGVSCYCEICGLGPSQVAGAVGFGGGLWESAVVRFHPSGKVNAYVGVSPHGQGEETTFAQIVSDELGVPVDDVEIIHGDTASAPMGWGTYGSRTTAVGAGALVLGLRKIKDKATALAAHLSGGRRGRHRVCRRPILGQRVPRPEPVHPGHCLDGQCCLEYAGGNGTGAGGLRFLRPAQLRLSFRSSRRRGDRRPGQRVSRTPALCGGRRLRPPDQPHDCTRADTRRRGPRGRPGPVGGCGLRRQRPTAYRDHERLRAAQGPYGARHRDHFVGDSVAPQSVGGQGNWRNGDHSFDCHNI